jgi:hypothetical protein
MGNEDDEMTSANRNKVPAAHGAYWEDQPHALSNDVYLRCLQFVTFLVVGILASEAWLVTAFDRVFHASEREREKLLRLK